MIVEVSVDSKYFQESMDIYDASFPKWEKEPLDMIRQRVQSGRYVVFAYILQGKSVGFYILDLHPSLGYVLFTYLAVDEAMRGEGIGTKLCKDAINRFEKSEFSWMFIEAEDRQAVFYAKLGFEKVQIDYAVPKYDDEGVVSMHLLCMAKGSKELRKEFLAEVIESIYIEGYFLDPADKRIAMQLEKLPEKIRLSKELHVEI